jgi:hypothetical protein
LTSISVLCWSASNHKTITMLQNKAKFYTGIFCSGLYNKQVLVGCWSFAAEGLWALCDNIYECACCYNCCHGNAVKGFWALWDNIYDHMCLLLQIVPSFLTGNLLDSRICENAIETCIFIWLYPDFAIFSVFRWILTLGSIYSPQHLVLKQPQWISRLQTSREFLYLLRDYQLIYKNTVSLALEWAAYYLNQLYSSHIVQWRV